MLLQPLVVHPADIGDGMGGPAVGIIRVPLAKFFVAIDLG